MQTERREHNGHGATIDAADSSAERSLGSLLVELTRELNDLFLTEVELIRTEVSAKIEQAATGLLAVLAGGLIALAGMLALVAAAVIALNDFYVHEWWLSTFIVGVSVTGLGVVLVLIGKSRAHPRELVPERVVRNVEADTRVLKQEREYDERRV
jgi:hypothetical protein